ncbi:MAG: GUN4 domain-containing protein [Crocosphaera sp.]|nr:GUN4 domain-containing protein [Crocosphaera sp.]
MDKNILPLIIAPVAVALLAGGTSPWWYEPLSKLWTNDLPPTLTNDPPPTPQTPTVSYKLLEHYLKHGYFMQADEETSRILLQITDNLVESHNSHKDSEKIECSVYQTIDNLWKKYSETESGKSKFGFSIQRRIWEIDAGSDGDDFGERVGWKKNGNWLTYNDLTNSRARNLEEVPAGYLPSKFRGPSANPSLHTGLMFYLLLSRFPAGKCLP